MKEETNFKIYILLLLVILIGMGMYLIGSDAKAPVGLSVVRPDVGFFECAKKVHGNYRFYYEQGQEEFMFERNGELCYVNTMQFRVEYIRMFGRSNEVFVGGEK